MRRVGTVVRAVQGMVIVRADDESVPAIGEPVVDESLDRVGTVVDVIGPVDRPYIVIAPADDRRPPTVLNTRLYVR